MATTRFIGEDEVDGAIHRWYAVEIDGEIMEFALAEGGWPDENGRVPEGTLVLDADGCPMEDEGDVTVQRVRRAIAEAQAAAI